ncbi:hypothetical protein D6C91_08514 [Aureobasidium pullulans]|uniref:Uncharacterized protein n=1 Tax=Aureobasidium pullulans TaxID=5580 RepID=A0A4S9SPW2_AURPU|nr:hypothetical protein D6C91_08514 [Aureobasidium pullulans]
MGFGETNNILGLRAQITANLAIVVKNLPIKIITLQVEGGFRAIVLDSKKNSVAITEACKDPTKYRQDETATDALDRLLQLSSKMALDKLRSDGNTLVVPKKLKFEGFSSNAGPFSGGPSGVNNNDASFGSIINGGPFGSSTKGEPYGGAATDSGHCGKRTIGGCGCGCLCGCGCSNRPPGIDRSGGPPGGDKLTCPPSGGFGEVARQDEIFPSRQNLEEYEKICSAMLSLPDSAVESAAEKYLKDQLKRNKQECRNITSVTGGDSIAETTTNPFELGPSERWNRKVAGGLFGNRETPTPESQTTGGLLAKGASTFPNAKGNIFDDDGSGDGFEERVRRRMEMLGNDPAPYKNSNTSGGMFGGVYKPSAPSTLFKSSQPSIADDDIEENSDSKRARNVAEALPTGLNPPHRDSTLSSGFGSLESIPAANSLPSFSESWRTSSFGRPTVNAPVTQPSLFGTFGSGLSENVPSVNRFGDGTSSRVSGDVQTIRSRPSATFGSMPSFSSAAGSNYTGFGGLPTPKASTDTRSEEKPVNLDRTREVFGNPAKYSSGFGGGFGSSIPSSSIKGSTVRGSPFAHPSASGDFGSSARLAQLPASRVFGSSAGNGPFDRYTAKHNDTKRLSSSDEEWEVESDL